jgi:hypothetical protein
MVYFPALPPEFDLHATIAVCRPLQRNALNAIA